MKTQFIAHLRKKDRKPQYLWEHLEEVSAIAGEFAGKIGLKEAGRLIGLLHDLGKASDAFDKYIKSATGLTDPDTDDYVDAAAQKGKVDHSSAGAQMIFREFSSKGAEGVLTAQFLSLCVASHHSGLIDCLTPDGLDNYRRRMEKSKEKTHTDEALSYLEDAEQQKVNELFSDQSLMKQLVGKLNSLKEGYDSKETLTFKYGLLLRFLFSCLIDADRLN
ncbi:MAG: CRISPR-associated endonuclease Cas3'', partial [Bacteroidota bacterium]